MRHIKFRAWSYTTKSFFHRVLVGNTNEDAEDYVATSVWVNQEWMSLDSRGGEVSQWTNFVDNNGTEVYEGDLVTLGDVTRRVYFNEPMGMWECVAVHVRPISITNVHSARILSLSYCISVGYVITGHKWS